MFLSIEQARKGHEVHVAYVLPGLNTYLDAFHSESVQLHSLGSGLSSDIWRAQKSPRVLWRLAKLVQKLRPNIIQSWNRPMDTFVGTLSYLTRFHWILSERSSGGLYNDRREWVRTKLAARTSAIVANSNEGRDYWRGKVPTSVRRAVIANIVRHRELQMDESPVAWPEGFIPARTFLYVGRFSHEKNVHVMINAMMRAAEAFDVRFVLCGAGELLEREKSRVHDAGLSHRFHWPGLVSNPWQWMKRVAGVISVSLCEGHPNVVAEAMAVNAPLLVSDIAAHRAILDEQSAVFVSPHSAEGISDNIGRMLDDVQSNRVKADHAYLRSQPWTGEAIVEAYESLYRSLIENPLRAPERNRK